MDRAKYGGESSKELGSGGNLKPWQSQKSSIDSCLYRVDENMTASTYSLNKIPERNLETVLSQSVQSIPLYLMPRPNSVAGKELRLPPCLDFRQTSCTHDIMDDPQLNLKGSAEQ